MKMGNTTEVVELSTESSTPWKLQQARTISLTSEPITSLVISKTEETLTEGDSILLSVETAPAYATDHTVTWASSDETVATVDSTGMVRAIAAGSAEITATANDASGLKATCKLTVKKKDSGIFNTTAATLSIVNQGSILTVGGLAKGVEVSVYDAAGKLVTAATAADGTVTVDTALPVGSTVIVKVGEDSIKISL